MPNGPLGRKYQPPLGEGQARAYLNDNVVLCIVKDTLTKGERVLVDGAISGGPASPGAPGWVVASCRRGPRPPSFHRAPRGVARLPYSRLSNEKRARFSGRPRPANLLCVARPPCVKAAEFERQRFFFKAARREPAIDSGRDGVCSAATRLRLADASPPR